MRVLLLVQDKQRVNLDSFYRAISEHSESCEIRRLSANQQADLKNYFFDTIDTEQYDRIIFFLRFKKEIKQRKFIQTVPNLVILEHDASQNYTGGKYHGEFSKHYRALPWSRIICSGYTITQQLQAEGFDAHFVGKGYDSDYLYNTHQTRDIDLAFVGSTHNKLYKERKAILEKMASEKSLKIMRTNTPEEYLQTLNRIKIFFSADIGLGEYMIKNFEAMACGCLLLAFDHGELENNTLGLIDMENIVLYKNYDEACKKLDWLISHPDEVKHITIAGQQLVEQTRTVKLMGQQVAETLKAPLRQPMHKKKLFGLFNQVDWKEPEGEC